MAKTTRNGWYWSGDLGYVDEDGWVYFAGRTSDWLRVDGENFPAAPIETIVGRHPDVMLASVYGVPDVDAGDQIMVALVLRRRRHLRSGGDGRLARRPGRPQSQMAAPLRPGGGQPFPRRRPTKCSPAPSSIRSSVPIASGGTPLFVRGRGEDAYRPFAADDEAALHEAFVAAGRGQAWDL